MNAKKILHEQFSSCYDENRWFVALKNALHGVAAENAAWKPEDVDNSIWEILSHLNFYNYAYLERFKGVDHEYGISSNDDTFSQASIPSEKDWRQEVDRFDSIMSGWREEIANADESRFAELAPPRNESPWWQVIANINIHNAHHGGQIVLLKKLQGIWDVDKGVS
jgi:uncharacterized damage-inducible protein DinB